MMFHYFCYGLRITSELEMPELTLQEAVSEVSDVYIKFGEFDANGPHDAQRISQNLWIGNQVLRFHVQDVACYEVRQGSLITLMPLRGSDPLSIRLYLQGSALGALLMQRNYLVLHGNAIQIENNCMICIGDSGTGKSTLAAAFLKRGHDVLADDLVPIRIDGCAIPGFPRIKLWQDAADVLDVNTDNLLPILPGINKFNLPLVRDESILTPLPVRWIYWLDWHDSKQISLEIQRGMKIFPVLNANLYRRRFIHGQQMLAENLKRCASLANQVTLIRVKRPANRLHSAQETAEILINSMRG